MKILLAIDSSAHSDRAIDVVSRQALAEDTEIHVLFVVEHIVPMAYGMGVIDTTAYDALERDTNELARSTIEKAADRLRSSGPAARAMITTSVGSGSPKRVILDTAEALRADLIVVGSHGYGAVNRFLLGSVSQAIAQHAECSVLIVRTPNEPEHNQPDADSLTSARPHHVETMLRE